MRKQTPTKGIHRGRRRRPLWRAAEGRPPFVGACFRTFGVFDKLRRHQDPSKCIKIHANPSIQSSPGPIGPILGHMGPLYGGYISFRGTPLLHISFCGHKIDTPICLWRTTSQPRASNATVQERPSQPNAICIHVYCGVSTIVWEAPIGTNRSQ